MPGNLRLAGAIVFVGAAWGAMYATYPAGVAHGGTAWLAALRFHAFFLGALAVAAALRTPLRPRQGGDLAAIAAYAGCSVVLHNLLLMAGSAHVPVAQLGIVTGLNPLLTVVLAAVLLREGRIGTRAAAGVALGLAGVAILAVQRGPGGWSVGPWTLVVLAGVAAWSVGSVLLKRARPGLPPLSIAVWGALLGAIVLHGAAAGTGPMPPLTLDYLAIVLFAGLVGGLAAFVVWGGIVRAHGPQRANLASYVSPVAASLAAWILLGQALRLEHAIAYALVALGLTLSVAAGRPRQHNA